MTAGLALSLLLSSLAVPAFAQGTSSANEVEEQASDEPGTTEGLFGSTKTQDLLPEGLTADQFIQYFTLFSADEDIDTAVEPIFAEMLKPGPMVEGWEAIGINIIEEFEALEGGLADNLLFEESADITSIIDFSGTAKPDFSNFQSYALRPEIPYEAGERVFLKFSSDVWFETFQQREVTGNALCYSGYVGVTLHSKTPYTRWSEDELLTNTFLFAMVDRMANLEVCVVYEARPDGQYGYAYYLPDGRTLPTLNDQGDVSLRVSLAQAQEVLDGTAE